MTLAGRIHALANMAFDVILIIVGASGVLAWAFAIYAMAHFAWKYW